MNLSAVFNALVRASKTEALPPENKLLSKRGFDKYVLLRSMCYCVMCDTDEPATIAHHILDRRLFEDGGYYLGNGAALCHKHHSLAEATVISVEKLRQKARIGTPVLPPKLDPEVTYDKWGNMLISSKMILLGPLKDDPLCQRALVAGKKSGKLFDVIPVMINEVPEDKLPVTPPPAKLGLESAKGMIKMMSAAKTNEPYFRSAPPTPSPYMTRVEVRDPQHDYVHVTPHFDDERDLA